MSDVSMRQMLEAGVHFGHQARFWCPKMAPYLYGVRNKIHIINLESTLPLYQEAMNFIGSIAAKKGRILFVGTKRAARLSIAEGASQCGMPYVDQRWMGGMLTNFKTVKQSISRLIELETMFAEGEQEKLKKKEALKLDRERSKLDRNIGGIKDMKKLPDAVFIVDVGHEQIAVKEANKLGIPIIGIVDSNNTPDGIDYIIPGNDDAVKAIKLYVGSVVAAISNSQEMALPPKGKDTDFVEVTDEPAEKVAS